MPRSAAPPTLSKHQQNQIGQWLAAMAHRNRSRCDAALCWPWPVGTRKRLLHPHIDHRVRRIALIDRDAAGSAGKELPHIAVDGSDDRRAARRENVDGSMIVTGAVRGKAVTQVTGLHAHDRNHEPACRHVDDRGRSQVWLADARSGPGEQDDAHEVRDDNQLSHSSS